MAAQCAARHNDVIKTYVTRLIDAGQPFKSALVAAMRKILICLRSLLMNPCLPAWLKPYPRLSGIPRVANVFDLYRESIFFYRQMIGYIEI